jgi:hypothetical protein
MVKEINVHVWEDLCILTPPEYEKWLLVCSHYVSICVPMYVTNVLPADVCNCWTDIFHVDNSRFTS